MSSRRYEQLITETHVSSRNLYNDSACPYIRTSVFIYIKILNSSPDVAYAKTNLGLPHSHRQ